MTISRLSTTYRRSIAVTLPDGREAWVAHEAQIEASYEPDELQGVAIKENFEQLRQIAMKEVSGAIKKEKDALEAAAIAAQKGSEEAFPSQDTELAKLPRV